MTYGWRTVTDKDWQVVQARAADLLERNRDKAYFRQWTANPYLPGELGAAVFAAEVGLDFDTPLRPAGEGDGGFDLLPALRLDVKATQDTVRPALIRDLRKAMAAEYWPLVVVNVAERSGRYLGWATRGDLLAAEVIEQRHGPARTLYAERLRAGVPPTVEAYLRGVPLDELMAADEGPEPDYRPPPDSPFQIPSSALRELG